MNTKINDINTICEYCNIDDGQKTEYYKKYNSMLCVECFCYLTYMEGYE